MERIPLGTFCRHFWPKRPCPSIRKVLCWLFTSPWPVQSVTDISPDVPIFLVLYIIAHSESITSDLNSRARKNSAATTLEQWRNLAFSLWAFFSYLINPPPWPFFLSSPSSCHFCHHPTTGLVPPTKSRLRLPITQPCSEHRTRHLLQLNHATSISPSLPP